MANNDKNKADNDAGHVSPISALKQSLSSLNARRVSIERLLSSLAQSPGGPLVDQQGFPRADIDVHAIAIQRNQRAVLETDHRALMKEIEQKLHELHRLTKSAAAPSLHSSRVAPTDAQPPALAVAALTINEQKQLSKETQENNIAAAPVSVSASPASSPVAPCSLSPFYVVESVLVHSPADLAGLCAGDAIVQFGSVNEQNHSNQAMAQVTQSSVGKTVRVRVLRDGALCELALVPQVWAGPGLLGCHMKQIK